MGEFTTSFNGSISLLQCPGDMRVRVSFFFLFFYFLFYEYSAEDKTDWTLSRAPPSSCERTGKRDKRTKRAE